MEKWNHGMDYKHMKNERSHIETYNNFIEQPRSDIY